MKDSKKNKLLNLIISVDRRVVYFFVLLAVSLPFFLKPVVAIKPTRWVKSTYEIVEEAARLDKPIIISFDYDPSTLAELQPMAETFLRHAFSRNVKVLGLNFLITGTSLGASAMDKIAQEYGKEYGKDYVYFGYAPQFDVVLLSFGDDFRKPYAKDYRGNDVNTLPMLNNFQNYDDFHLVICISGTRIPQSFLIWGVNRFKFNFVAGVTAVSATEYYTYLNSGQMKGLLAGMKGAAEYEFIIGQIGDAMRGMASQTWGHLTIIFFIIVGNIIFYLKKKYENEENGGNQ